MTTFNESNLQFDFDTNWANLILYDAHADVCLATGKQLSCIDFLGVHRGNKLFFFEVKNFKNRRPEQHTSIESKLMPDSQSKDDTAPPLVKAIVKNVKDSLLFLTVFSKRNPVTDATNWAGIRQLLEDRGKEIYVVLWLELDAAYPNLPSEQLLLNQQVISQKLAQKLSWLTPNVLVASAVSHPFRTSLTVTDV